MSAPIFISYSSKDRQIAETICQALEARGQNCWIACRDVRAGENFQEAIVRALREAQVMLLVFTSNANNSDEIKKELVLAGRHHVTVVPARVEDVIPNDAFSYELATRQWIDLFKDWEREIETLSQQLALILRAAGKAEPITTSLPIPPAYRKKDNTVLIAALALLILLIAGALAFLRPWAGKASIPSTAAVITESKPPATVAPPAPQTAVAVTSTSPPVQTARPSVKHAAPVRADPTQTAVTTPAAPPPAAPSQSAAQPAAAAPRDPDETAWQMATGAATRDGFDAYLKDFPAGTHVQEAQLQIATLILNMPATGANFDGTWQTIWTCPNLGQYPGYTFQFSGQVRDGVYHGIRGAKGEPSSMVLDGKIEADGAAAFSGEVIVGSSLVGLGAARGTPSDFHATALFAHGSGTGKRLEGRACMLTFEKQ